MKEVKKGSWSCGWNLRVHQRWLRIGTGSPWESNKHMSRKGCEDGGSLIQKPLRRSHSDTRESPRPFARHCTCSEDYHSDDWNGGISNTSSFLWYLGQFSQQLSKTDIFLTIFQLRKSRQREISLSIITGANDKAEIWTLICMMLNLILFQSLRSQRCFLEITNSRDVFR